MDRKAPFPIIRHHFGLPTLKATQARIARIAEARVLDAVSLAHFFHPERRHPHRTGAGGVPVRNVGDIGPSMLQAEQAAIPYSAYLYPCTDDSVRLVEMYVKVNTKTRSVVLGINEPSVDEINRYVMEGSR